MINSTVGSNQSFQKMVFFENKFMMNENLLQHNFRIPLITYTILFMLIMKQNSDNSVILKKIIL